jgi:RNA-directed DNA polymerase
MPQKPGRPGRAIGASGEAASAVARVEAPPARSGNERPGTQGAVTGLMEKVVERPNLLVALKRVRENKGSPGIDGMTVKELPAFLKVHWPRLREQLLAGRYRPHPVRRVVIPKPGGGERELGIPTVLDRFIQQALLQVLQPRFDPTFSEASLASGRGGGRTTPCAARRPTCRMVVVSWWTSIWKDFSIA